MDVLPLIQRVAQAEAVSLNVASVEEGDAVAAWAKNNQFFFVGEIEGEPGVFMFHLGVVPWHQEIRSDAGCYVVRYEPTFNPDFAAELYWPSGMTTWEPYPEGAALAAPWTG